MAGDEDEEESMPELAGSSESEEPVALSPSSSESEEDPPQQAMPQIGCTRLPTCAEGGCMVVIVTGGNTIAPIIRLHPADERREKGGPN